MTLITTEDMLKLATRARDDAGSLSHAEVEALGTWLLEHQEPWSQAHYAAGPDAHARYRAAEDDLMEGEAD